MNRERTAREHFERGLDLLADGHQARAASDYAGAQAAAALAAAEFAASNAIIAKHGGDVDGRWNWRGTVV
jgi:hypothetical protein